MYAVIESGGKQHRVEEGEILRLEKLEATAGDKVNFDKILLLGEGQSVKIGTPYLDGCQVEAEVVKQGRGDKIKIIKFNRRKHYKKQQGHRQLYTEVRITGIKE
ncbi:MAG: 50S ribosomal protein L21 [Gammaproteobacteria bacterium]|nr:50S ribosomal protein L21 [Gammaproteobacteria bacterium]|tara:strand:- start:257 stop:568 length:312 start_codon:yes stop_codon:yes gene_type:complete